MVDSRSGSQAGCNCPKDPLLGSAEVDQFSADAVAVTLHCLGGCRGTASPAEDRHQEELLDGRSISGFGDPQETFGAIRENQKSQPGGPVAVNSWNGTRTRALRCELQAARGREFHDPGPGERCQGDRDDGRRPAVDFAGNRPGQGEPHPALSTTGQVM